MEVLLLVLRDMSVCVPPNASYSYSAAPASDPLAPDPPVNLGLLSVGCQGLAARWYLPGQLINYLGQYPPRLLLCPPPSPLMEAVRLLRVPFLDDVSLFPPHSYLVLQWGASACMGILPPYPVSGQAQRAGDPARGVPPLPPLGQRYPHPSSPACLAQGAHAAWGVIPLGPLGQGVPTLPLLHGVRWEHTLIGGGAPPFSLLARGPPHLPLLHAVHEVHTLPFGGGPPPYSDLRMRVVVARGLLGVAPSCPCPRAGCALC